MTSAQAGQQRAVIQDMPQDRVLTVTLQGELDVASTPALCGYLSRTLRGTPGLIVLDLAGVRFMDCAAAAAVIRICRDLPGGPRLIMCHPRPVVRRLLSLTGLDAHCAVRP